MNKCSWIITVVGVDDTVTGLAAHMQTAATGEHDVKEYPNVRQVAEIVAGHMDYISRYPSFDLPVEEKKKKRKPK